MKMNMLILTIMVSSAILFAQDEDSGPVVNSANLMLQENNKLTLGGYAQIDYNQPVNTDVRNNGTLDVHRLVLLFGYKFNDRTKFITEIEYEHVREIFVEQAFLQYEITPWINFRGGLMLIPMGIINEFHEPPTFNGVERPNVDNYIIPSTWREIGAGFSGTFPIQGISYQVYLLNGFAGYTDEALISGADGFRKGRQKGAESFLSAPNFAMKIDFFGLPGLQLGLSGYTGKTQTSLYHGVEHSDTESIARADSSVLQLNMIGADVRYNLLGFRFRGQVHYGLVGNTIQYNEFTGSDAGSMIYGWYGELAYNVFSFFDTFSSELIPFLRYEKYNTQADSEGDLVKNPAYNRSDLTLGAGWKITDGAMLKADYQILMHRGAENYIHQLNLGIGVWF